MESSREFWSVPENLGSTKELQRVSSSFWRFLEIFEIFGNFGYFWKVFENFRRPLWSFIEFRGVLEIFEESQRVFGKSESFW